MPERQTFSPGAWVVHRHHGVGQIKSTETKRIGEQSNTYCKIKMFNSTIWLPVDKVNEDWLRPLATPADIQRALEILKSPPQPMSDNLNSRKSRIKEVDSNDAPAVIAELLRDLWALKKEKKTLSQAEEAALNHFTNCFLTEWSVSEKGTVEEVKQKFESLLRQGREQREREMESQEVAEQ